MTIRNVSLLPLDVCCVKVAGSKWVAAGGGVKTMAAVAFLSGVLWSPPSAQAELVNNEPEWIYSEAQWGQPSAPFLLSRNILYTAGTFDSGREVRIGDTVAGIHVLGGTRLHLSGVVSSQGSSTAGLEKLGAGTLALSGVNTYHGNTILREGTLHVAGDSALGKKINSLWAQLGSVVSYAPGATIFNQMHLMGSNGAPGGTPPEPASWELADSVQWRVDSGVAVQAGNVVGSVPVVKQGHGTLRLTGIAGYPSFFTVNQGALAVDWHLAGAVRVNRNARLEGSGTIRSATIMAGGILSPGNGMGDTAAFTVTEKLEFKPGAVFEVDASALGQADIVQVAGKALLDGQVLARAEQGDWKPSTRYTVLYATDGFDQTRFASAATNLPFLTPALSYDDQAVYLSLDRNGKPLDEAAETPTEDEVANVVDQNDNPGVHDEVVVMDQPQASEAFGQLSGSWMASVRSAMLEDSRFVREAVLQNAVARQSPYFWSHAFASAADRVSEGGTPADERDIGGLVLGVARPIAAGWNVGGFFGVQHGDMRRRQAMAGAQIDSTHAGLSLAGRWRDVDLAVGLAHTWHKIRSQRKVAVAGLQDALSGSYRGRTLQVFGEIAAPLRWLGHALASTDVCRYGLKDASAVEAVTGVACTSISGHEAMERRAAMGSGDEQPHETPTNTPIFSPFARLAWVQARIGGFVEKGSASALNVLPATQAVLLSTVGLRAEHIIETATGIARMRAELAWRHAGGNIRAFSRQSFRDSATQSRFESEGLPVARQAWSLQLGVSASLARNASLGVGYTGQFSPGRQDHGVRMQAAWSF